MQRPNFPAPNTRTFREHRITFDYFWTLNAAFAAMVRLATQIAAGDGRVLLLGETGCGKLGLAIALHAASPRTHGPFVRMNVASLAASVLEAEMYGCEKGAFTGASEARKGHFRSANGGTLFIDELPELPLLLQPKLLQAIDERSVTPVGGADAPYDARLVFATHRPLETLAGPNSPLREDLLHRVTEMVLTIPPLRERPEDIVPLFQWYLDAAKLPPTGLARAAQHRLLAHPWPGNVRELRNTARRTTLACAGREVQAEEIVFLPASRVPPSAPVDHGPERMTEVRRLHVQRILAECGGNRQCAAARLGISESGLYNLLKRYAAG